MKAICCVHSEPEEWRDVAGYVGYYRVSNRGRVERLSVRVRSSFGKTRVVTGRILKPHKRRRGYLSVRLSKSGKTRCFLVHRLVLEAFCGSCPLGMVSRHTPDRTTTHNCRENLIWGTQKENVQDAIKDGTYLEPPRLNGESNSSAVLTSRQVKRIKVLLHAKKWSVANVASLYRVSYSVVWSIKTGRSWSWLT